MDLVEFVADIAKLALIAAGLYLVLRAVVRRKLPAWAEPVEKRRLLILSGFVLLVTAIKVIEDVVEGESGVVDDAVLRFVHDHVPDALTGFFEAVTWTGSWKFLLPLSVAVTLAFAGTRHRFEALLVATSVTAAALVVYVVKAATGRARPALWDTEWYWGSSFPSGHTLVVAAFATATVLCIDRIRPASRRIAWALALAWIVLVAFSRLVLGVHWPTDVLAAACIGAFIPMAVGAAIAVAAHRRAHEPTRR
ncbi:MAG: phosphatase PAP2 family protein [Betaproteobacteria bacterium]